MPEFTYTARDRSGKTVEGTIQAANSAIAVGRVREMGYDVATPEGTFYLFPRSPLADDEAFVKLLADEGVLVMPGRLFETPGFFRICLTATMATIEASLPRFAAVLDQVRAG